MSTQVVIVEFTKTGGIAGIRQHLTISNNGHGTLSGAPRANHDGFDLDEAAMGDLRQALADARISELDGQDFPCTGRDQFTYTITFEGATVTMCDDKVPEQLQSVTKLLDQIARENGGI